MAFICATLAHEVDGKVEYVYPKTIASVVEYDESDSVKTKIEKIDQNINDINYRITDIVENMQSEIQSLKNILNKV